MRSTATGTGHRGCAPRRATASCSTTRPCSRCSASPTSSRASRTSRATRSAPRRRGPGSPTASSRDHRRARRRTPTSVRLHALGRMRVARATIDRWLEHAARMRHPPDPRVSVEPGHARRRMPRRAIRVRAADLRPRRHGCAGRARSSAASTAGPRAPRPRPVPAPAPARPARSRELGAELLEASAVVSAASGESERFERLYAAKPGPVGLRTSGTSARSTRRRSRRCRDRDRIGCALEVGCSIGVFTGLLAARCEHVVAIDFSPRALELAAEHLRRAETSSLLRAAFPEERRRAHGIWSSARRSSTTSTPALDEAIRWLSSAARATARACSR